MDDYISRQAAVKETWREPSYTDPLNVLTEIRDRLSALPSAQPKSFRVIDKQTGKEADPYNIALTEEWAKGLIYCDMEGFAILEDGTLMLTDECGRYEFCPEGRFEVIWNG